VQERWDTSFFDTIDSAAKAWVLGYLGGKGGLNHDRGNTYLTIYIPSRDKQLINIYKEILDYKGVVTRDKRSALNVDHFRIRVKVTGLETRLRALGIGTKRAYLFPFQEVPKRFHPDLIRGWLEAAGSWSKGKGRHWYLYICAQSTRAVEEFKTWAQSIGCIGKLAIHEGPSTKLYITSQSDMREIYRALYVCDTKLTIPHHRKRAETAIITALEEE